MVKTDLVMRTAKASVWKLRTTAFVQIVISKNPEKIEVWWRAKLLKPNAFSERCFVYRLVVYFNFFT